MSSFTEIDVSTTLLAAAKEMGYIFHAPPETRNCCGNLFARKGHICSGLPCELRYTVLPVMGQADRDTVGSQIVAGQMDQDTVGSQTVACGPGGLRYSINCRRPGGDTARSQLSWARRTEIYTARSPVSWARRR